uniref:Coat protein n=1 Tax=Podosphaera prunicola tobamo-like virus TaxID=2052571 RepID=A0A2P9JAN2_9VIRU|nr:coat protein [Podosphaera prunicola tobamo-like virus]
MNIYGLERYLKIGRRPFCTYLFFKMSLQTFICGLCSTPFTDLEAHINESHSSPEPGEDGLTDAQRLRALVATAAENVENEVHLGTAAAENVFDALAELGVRREDLATCIVTTETGAACTTAEAKRAIAAVGTHVKFAFNKTDFIVNFVDWGIRNGFAEELAEAGGFIIRSDPSQPPREVYVKMEDLQTTIASELGRAGTGRSFTFRRFGRYLANSIPTIVAQNPTLNRYYLEGSPMSNRLGIAPKYFLTCTSLFEYIKPYSKWSNPERLAWNAHNRSITKVSTNQDIAFAPEDMRPSPAYAQIAHDEGKSDFTQRHYASAEKLSRMLNNKRQPQDKSGLGFQ